MKKKKKNIGRSSSQKEEEEEEISPTVNQPDYNRQSTRNIMNYHKSQKQPQFKKSVRISKLSDIECFPKVIAPVL